MKEDVLTVSSVVEDMLKKDHRARNNDKWLTFLVLRSMGFRIFIPYGDMEKMPSFESISRCRRKLQEKGLYLADLEVVAWRSEEQKEMTGINKWM
jgi:hypothetical protein